MPVAEYKTAESAIFFKIGLRTYGYVRWNNTEIFPNSKNVRNVNCWHTAGAVLLWQAVKTAISMPQTHSAGKKWKVLLFRRE